MIDSKVVKYEPDEAIAPGETIREAMEARSMNQTEMAMRLRKSKPEITAILKGSQAISPEVAMRLEAVLGVPASFWLNLQVQYEQARARTQWRETLEKEAVHAQRFPYAQMASLGWLPKTTNAIEKAKNLLAFFAVSSLKLVRDLHTEAYATQYRKSARHEANPDHLAAWLRQGEIEAMKISAAAFNRERFHAYLPALRSLSQMPAAEAGAQLQSICRECGIAVVFLPHLAKTYVNGATMWLRPEGTSAKTKPVILLSVRYRWADVFWFTFFHEIFHVFAEKKSQVFINLQNSGDGEEERKADRYARDILIPVTDYQRLSRLAYFPEAEVLNFAREIGVAPGIVVGRLQHDRLIPQQNLNHLRQRYAIRG